MTAIVIMYFILVLLLISTVKSSSNTLIDPRSLCSKMVASIDLKNPYILHHASLNDQPEIFDMVLDSRNYLHVRDQHNKLPMDYVSTDSVYDAMIFRFFIEFKGPSCQYFENRYQLKTKNASTGPLTFENVKLRIDVLIAILSMTLKMNRFDDFYIFAKYFNQLDIYYGIHISGKILLQLIQSVDTIPLTLLRAAQPVVLGHVEDAIFLRAILPGGTKLFNLLRDDFCYLHILDFEGLSVIASASDESISFLIDRFFHEYSDFEKIAQFPYVLENLCKRLMLKMESISLPPSENGGEIDLETDIFITIDEFFERIMQEALQKQSHQIIQLILKTNPHLQFVDGNNIL